MPRNIRHNYSTHAAGRGVQSTFRRGEVIPKFTANFAEALTSVGEYVTGATWYCGNYQSVVMSNAISDTTTTSVALQCQYPCESWLKVVATTSTGAKHAMVIAVNVMNGWWFQGETTTPVSGPYILTCVSAIPAGPTLTLTGQAPDGVVGLPFSYSYTRQGGTGPWLFYLAAGTLPNGITLNQSTGQITGTPTTAATFSFTIGVSSADGQAAMDPDGIVVTAATLDQVVAQDSPLIYLKLNETTGTTATDYSGHGYPGTYGGTYVQSPVALRPGGRSIQVGVPTINDFGYVTIPDGGYDSAFTGDQWTVEVVMRCTTTPLAVANAPSQQIVSKFLSPLYGSATFEVVADVSPTMKYFTGVTSDAVTHEGTLINAPNLLDNNTHIITLSKNGPDMRMYIDGELAGTGNRIGAAALSATPISIGSIYAPPFIGPGQFQGYISDFQLYDHVLSDARILLHAQAAGLHA